ncbi:tRNA threonylcarbamoyladenosine biosynthesis protein TsaB [Natronincola peptidivorans]|uniref:tRNA threonylcarbamoyladenosine biosynthesis protein TsaB n=1 Tax=Natronincola peptidivorans TaxID=426128 RepID=A0A1H9ZXE4_9FIRM|nr:tRNA (adenosine(37)-N6)-threonylcarbamoyltransferase complex dimerization subunit type 1 TsaB [Natronincola peptidivorans]SES86477.1 tRNA threonylcarbamoyladenosine biosynthesis protein TsaB [Natronincola peptidivorans]
MKLLALDTSSIVATAAVLNGEKLMGEYILNHKKTHSQKLMPMLEEILKSCELSPKDIDVFGVAVGPGSFTGLRIGLATIKAMAQALDKPMVGISTLEGLAFNLIYCEKPICPIIDAQRDLVYTGLYQWQNQQLTRIMAEEVIDIHQLMAVFKEKQEKIVFVGDALEKFQGLIQEEMKDLAVFPPAIVTMPRASSIGELARRKAEKAEVSKPAEILPIYMRKSQAEKQWEEKMRNGS